MQYLQIHIEYSRSFILVHQFPTLITPKRNPVLISSHSPAFPPSHNQSYFLITEARVS